MKSIRVSALIVILVSLAAATSAHAASLFFLHHSTGRNLIEQGAVREAVAQRNAQRGTAHKFWDHDYNYIGLSNPAGELLGYNYGPAANNTDPDGLFALWTTANAPSPPRWGWALVSVAAPWVAHRVWPMPTRPRRGVWVS